MTSSSKLYLHLPSHFSLLTSFDLLPSHVHSRHIQLFFVFSLRTSLSYIHVWLMSTNLILFFVHNLQENWRFSSIYFIMVNSSLVNIDNKLVQILSIITCMISLALPIPQGLTCIIAKPYFSRPYVKDEESPGNRYKMTSSLQNLHSPDLIHRNPQTVLHADSSRIQIQSFQISPVFLITASVLVQIRRKILNLYLPLS